MGGYLLGFVGWRCFVLVAVGVSVWIACLLAGDGSCGSYSVSVGKPVDTTSI